MTRLPALVPLLLLAACEDSLSTWSGSGSFPVHAAFLTVCEDDQGATHALGVATSGRNCGGYAPLYDEPAAEPCDAWKALVTEACDPTATLTASATDALSFWMADLDADVGLAGATAEGAEHFRCQEQAGDVWVGETDALSGTVSVDAIAEGVATVGVELGDLTGDVTFTVCE